MRWEKADQWKHLWRVCFFVLFAMAPFVVKAQLVEPLPGSGVSAFVEERTTDSERVAAENGLPDPEPVDTFVYPLGRWEVVVEHGERLSSGAFHMGIDAGVELGSGAEVFAIANGVVVDVAERSLFGLVVLVEHELADGSRAVSLYGHLDPADERVAVGDIVEPGDIVGTLGARGVNGGWVPHIHFGIHKTAYTGDWVYYGHVHGADTAEEWYEPVSFLSERITTDTIRPLVRLSHVDDAFTDNALSFSAYVSDIGRAELRRVRVQMRQLGEEAWETVVDETDDVAFPVTVERDLSEWPDGRIQLRVKAWDVDGNWREKTVELRKKANVFSRVHVVGMKGERSRGVTRTFYETGDRKDGFRLLRRRRAVPGDVAAGTVLSAEEQHVVTVNGSGRKAKVRVMTSDGKERHSFVAFARKDGARVTTGDIDGDGIDEIIVGSGEGRTVQVRVFTATGQLLWKRKPFARNFQQALDVAAGDVDGDGRDEIIVGLGAGNKPLVAVIGEQGKRLEVIRAFEKEYRGGVSVAAGDVDGDGRAEIIAATNGERTAEVRVFEASGKKKRAMYAFPFGETFTGPLDVSSTDWEDDGRAEIIASQAGEGEAWVKTYRTDTEKTVLFEERIFESGYEGGAHIAGW